MNDPVLGSLEYDKAEGGWISGPISLPFLGGHQCRFVIQGYETDARPDELRAAIHNALDAEPSVLTEAEPYLRQYREDMLSLYSEEERPCLAVEDIWSQVQLGDVMYVSRRADGDAEDGIYLSLECNCDWEVEHGLQRTCPPSGRKAAAKWYDRVSSEVRDALWSGAVASGRLQQCSSDERL